MYIFQFMDGSYRIDRKTCTAPYLSDIFSNREAFNLYDGIYETRADADAAMNKIKEILAAR